jgi:IS5 family transposase
MRQERTVQASLFDLFAEHEIGRELKAMSAWLDDHRELVRLVAADLSRHGVKETGAKACRRRRCCAAPYSSSTVS